MSVASKRSGRRRASRTRESLLCAAFEEIWRFGFQAASLDAILRRAGVTKGALYHYFPNKRALGYAVVDEVLSAKLYEQWLQPIEAADDPIEGVIHALADPRGPIEALRLGCPLNNLVQEMSPIDDGFRERLDRLIRIWRKGVADALRQEQRSGRIRRDIEPESAAAFLVAACQGAIGLAKNAQSRDMLIACADGLARYAEWLRAPAGRRAKPRR